MSTNYDKFISDVTDQVIEYADKHGCTLAESLYDWEGDGPNGSFGLTNPDKDQVLIKLRARGLNGHDIPDDQYNKYEDAEMYPGGAAYNDIMFGN